jgi:adenylate kinase family enzyme
MKKIAIIGCGGSGKTYLAGELAERLAIPVHHLDRIFWMKGWIESGRDEFIHAQEEIFATDEWIIDGNYGGTMELRFKQADTVIFLDLPTMRCLWGVVARYCRYRNQTRPDMTEGNEERLTTEFLSWIVSYRRKRRPGILASLQEMMDHRQIIVLQTRNAVDRFIESVPFRAL